MSWMKTSSLLLVLVIAVVMMTAGCTSNQPATTPATTVATPVATSVPTTQVVATTAAPVQNGTGLANPASVYCGQVGGKTEIKKDATGAEYGMCTFPNGSSCEEWALYRGECKLNATVSNVTVKTPVTNLSATNKTVSNLTSSVNNTTTKK
jgi:putative hemolysin